MTPANSPGFVTTRDVKVWGTVLAIPSLASRFSERSTPEDRYVNGFATDLLKIFKTKTPDRCQYLAVLEGVEDIQIDH
jgi:hypothetical protein